MPGAQDSADQVKFLLYCISRSNNGRPDFAAVAEDLNIVSKAAAQKRYERMLKAHGLTPGRMSKGNDAGVSTPDATPVKRKTAAPRTLASAKKARGKGVKKEENNDEDSKEGVKKEEESESELSDPPPSE
ncbi:hypothetical protein E4U42_003703 [Claviceps africana]|uniref:Myb-like DNA-binding domain-containing protein n=1 Tax=Claviceps africana TaxID=83212 RepID=A0A8K0J6A7_9HYPO|nr:hypothetical protein E4U42_003703 [Claviceps africana]